MAWHQWKHVSFLLPRTFHCVLFFFCPLCLIKKLINFLRIETPQYRRPLFCVLCCFGNSELRLSFLRLELNQSVRTGWMLQCPFATVQPASTRILSRARLETHTTHIYTRARILTWTVCALTTFLCTLFAMCCQRNRAVVWYGDGTAHSQRPTHTRECSSAHM